MAILHVTTAGTSSEDGLDKHGTAITAGTFTTSTLNLQSVTPSAAFAALGVGDQFYVTGGTGVTPQMVEIVTKTDDSNVIVDVDIGGTDPTDVTTSTGPTSLQNAIDLTTAGNDTTYVQGGTDYTPTVTITWDGVSAGANARHEFIGVNSSWVDDGTFAVFDWASSAVTANDGTGSGQQQLYLKNFHFKDAGTTTSHHGFDMDFAVSASGGAESLVMENVLITGMAGNGVLMAEAEATFVAINCGFNDNGLHGVEVSFETNRHFILKKCEANENGGSGFLVMNSGKTIIDSCKACHNTTHGIGTDASKSSNNSRDIDFIYGNTLDNNGSNAIDFIGEIACVIMDNSMSNNGGFAVDTNGNDLGGAFCEANSTFNNTSGDTDDSNGLPGTRNSTADPDYVDDVAAGGLDYTPNTGSPLLEAGLPTRSGDAGATGGQSICDRGAVQKQAAAGGTSGLAGIGTGLIRT